VVAQLTIRKLDDDLVRRLKLRAAQNNRSAEAEVRAILEDTLQTPGKAADLIARARALRESLRTTYQGDSAQMVREQRGERTRHIESLMKPRRSRG
jgi:antitoxin FitA